MVACIIAQLINSQLDRERLMRILKLRVRSGPSFSETMVETRDFRNLCATLIEMARGFPLPIIIILDGLDECSDPSSIVRHLLEPAMDPSSIVDMMSASRIGIDHPIRFLLTGRPNVHDIFAMLPFVSTIDMDVSHDLRKFVHEKVADNEYLSPYEHQIIATIYENSQGMFRYAGETRSIQFGNYAD
jgi:hypothetical protein